MACLLLRSAPMIGQAQAQGSDESKRNFLNVFKNLSFPPGGLRVVS